MVEYDLAVMPGDGIGPEIMNQGIRVLNAIAEIIEAGGLTPYNQRRLGL